MGHLPSINDPISPYPRVPLLCRENYDGHSFTSYPSRCGFDPLRTNVEFLYGRSHADMGSFLQAWLYFGTLREVFDPFCSVKLEDFVREDCHGSFNSTAKLEEHIDTLFEGIRAMLQPEAEEVLKRIQSCLNQLCSTIEVICTSADSDLPNGLVLSVRVLGATLDAAISHSFGCLANRNWGLSDHAKSQMQEARWCPRDICMVESCCSELTLLYISYLRRDLQGQVHTRCSERICQANHVDKRSYLTKHVSSDCPCQDLQPDLRAVERIVSNGKIPIIALTPRRS
jgi:hypothetical protein